MLTTWVCNPCHLLAKPPALPKMAEQDHFRENNMHKRKITLGLLGLFAGLALSSLPVQATGTGRSSRSRRPPVDRGPAETRAERDKRLQRECRGKPNAGACEGYGS